MSTLHHFSEQPGIERFEPRLMPERPEVGGPLVWAVDTEYAFTYCFPRDCPRVLLWTLPTTTAADRERWFGASEARAIAHIEYAWLERLRSTRLHRYALPAQTFEAAGEGGGHGNYVSRLAVAPERVETVDDLVEALQAARVELRVLDRLTPLRGVWSPSLHASGFRLREPATGRRRSRARVDRDLVASIYWQPGAVTVDRYGRGITGPMPGTPRLRTAAPTARRRSRSRVPSCQAGHAAAASHGRGLYGVRSPA